MEVWKTEQVLGDKMKDLIRNLDAITFQYISKIVIIGNMLE